MRSLIIDPKNDGMVPLAELFLYEASRAQHMHDTVLPALKRGAIVICDRFADSSLVYQGVGRKLKPEMVKNLNKIATGGISPDVTVLIDLDPRIGLARVGARGVLDRLEREKLSFHKAVRNGFLALAKKEKKRFLVVDGSRSRDEIHEEIVDYLEGKGWL
jgi:dTMP kinase